MNILKSLKDRIINSFNNNTAIIIYSIAIAIIIWFVISITIYPTTPKTFFYDWLYVNAVSQNTELLTKLSEYNAFTDIAFNPEKSINCQARSAAICVSLFKKGLLSDALKNKDEFKKIVYSDENKITEGVQISFF
jgi:type I restriction enzyme M protein